MNSDFSAKNTIIKDKITVAAFAFLSGIYLCSILKPGWLVLLGCLIFLFVAAFVNRSDRISLAILMLTAILLMGMMDYGFINGRKSGLDGQSGSSALVECSVISTPKVKPFYTLYEVRLIRLQKGEKVQKLSEKAFLKIKGKKLYKFGSILTVNGEVKDFGGIRNFGDFDFRKYYKNKGFFKTIEADRIAVQRGNGCNVLQRFLFASKSRIREVIYAALPEEEASILYGIISGDRTEMEEETKEAYSKAGLSHILSVSGLHVGFLLILVNIVLKPLKLGRKIESVAVLLIVFYYILVIGAPTPALRAFLMLGITLGARLYRREYSLKPSISAAMLIILLIKPMSIHDPGFVISFGCMYSIAFLYQPVHDRLGSLPTFIRSPLALSLAVWFGITPIIIYYFNYGSLISILINLVAIPLSSVITIMGFIGVMVGCFSGLASIYIFSVCYYMLKLLNMLTVSAVRLPFAGFYIPRLPFYIWVVYYGIIIQFVVSAVSKFYAAYGKSFMAVSISLALLAVGSCILPGNNLKLIFLDVGQGDSTCIITPGKKVMLIDGGGSAHETVSTFDVGKNITVPALLHSGVWGIDTVAVSHIHDDHIQGLLKVFEVFKVNNLILPKTEYTSENLEELLALCMQKGVRVIYAESGDSLRLGRDIGFDVLAPGRTLISGTESDINNNSMVIKLNYKKFSALFTGDIQSEAEALILDKPVDADVLKVPHHGSPYSSTDEFLKRVTPKLSIIEVGKNNYGHPSKEAVQRLGKAGSKVLRVDHSGAVLVQTDGIRIRYSTAAGQSE